MTNFTRLTAASISLMVTIGGFSSSATNRPSTFDMHKYAYKGNFKRDHKGFRMGKADELTRSEITEGRMKAPESEMPTPDITFPTTHMIGDLDAPDGSVWFYTADYQYDYIQESEYYKRPIMQEYEFKIYDSSLNFVGSIRDKVNYKEGEVAVPSAELAPFITRNFFNSDDNYEVVVCLYVNTDIYVNNQYSIVYSLGGEKSDGYDKPVMTRTDMIGDVLNASKDGEENYFVTFMTDDNLEVTEKDPDNPDPDESDPIGYWEMLTSYGMKVTTYSKADSEGNLEKVWEKRIRLADLPGDQMSVPFLISFVRDGKPYFLYSQYEDTFFNPYYDFTEESTMRENNHLVAELYEVENGSFSLQQRTLIPMALNNIENEKILCSYYSIGSFRYRDDIRFGKDSDKPEYIVTVQDYSKENDENYEMSFYTYTADGTLKNTLYKNVAAHSSLADLDGFDPSQVFITTNVMGGYDFHIVNLTTGKEELSFSNQFEVYPDEDPDLITSNIDRVLVGDTFKYAIEMRSPGQDEDGNDLMRIMWIGKDGKFERFDEVPMGSNVYYATVLIDNQTLDPKLFDADDEYEYLILVKRGYPGNLVMEELLVAKPISEAYPEGKTLLQLSPDEERGALKYISPLANGDNPMLMVLYYNEETAMTSGDFYKLPFTSSNSSVESLPSGDLQGSGISFDGQTLRATGTITLFNAQGTKVAEGNGELGTSTLPAGIYVARSGGKSIKIFVK